MTGRPALRDGAHLLALSSFALAQPLFDLLGRNPEFFAVRGSTRWDVIAFALALTLGPPALLLGAELLAGLAHPRFRRGLHLLFVAALAAVIALEALRRLHGLPDALIFALAAGVGVAVGAGYRRAEAVRSTLTVLSAAAAVFLVLFVLVSPVRKLTLESEASAQVAKVPGRAPVVLVVFDEFPLGSLMDARHRIDPVRYPHFADLARHSTWFRTATTVSEGTTGAVPAILTGRYPRPHELPILDDHPQNIFTLVGGGYAVDGFEAETHLCPPSLCRVSADSFPGRMRSIAEDASVVYLHVLLPDDLERGLPPVSESWTNFLGRNHRAGEPARFHRFLASLTPSPRPTFYYVHLLLPHSPWQYLPSGKRYSIRYPVPPWGSDEVWTRDHGIVVQNHQRHLLQVAFVDRLLGEFLRRLRATRLYDRSLLVVTADEGISFQPGEKRRPVWPSNLHDIAFVPLFVKLPGQQAGRVVDAHAQTIDVLPTIADALGIRLPWHVDGHSVLGGGPGPRLVTVLKGAGMKVAAPLASLQRRRWAALARQVALFGSDTPPSSLYGLGPHRRLLGRPVGEARRIGADVSVSPLPDPVQVTGRVVAPVDDVAIAVGGRIAAVAPVYDGRFRALVPRSAFRAGVKVEVVATSLRR